MKECMRFGMSETVNGMHCREDEWAKSGAMKGSGIIKRMTLRREEGRNEGVCVRGRLQTKWIYKVDE